MAYNNDTSGDVLESATMRYAQNNREANSLKIRLETEDIKLKIGLFLTGTALAQEFDEKNNVPIMRPVPIGPPLVSKAGYQFIMSFVESVINKAVVQGNFPYIEDAYSYLSRIREGFSLDLWVCAPEYGVTPEKYNTIIRTIFALIEPFITRTIGDKERGTIRETTIQQDRIIQGGNAVSFNPLKIFK